MEPTDDLINGGVRTAGGDFRLQPICDMCGLTLTPEDTYNTELTAQGATCPTAMTLHQSCYEAASALWQPDEDGMTCEADPLFPETGQWNRMQRAADDDTV